jgi:predicted phosphatase
MDRTYLHTRRILTLLTLNGKINKSFFWNQIRVIVMVRVFEIDQVSSLESKDPDPLKLRIMARMIIFFHTGIDTSSAANTS